MPLLARAIAGSDQCGDRGRHCWQIDPTIAAVSTLTTILTTCCSSAHTSCASTLSGCEASEIALKDPVVSRMRGLRPDAGRLWSVRRDARRGRNVGPLCPVAMKRAGLDALKSKEDTS